ncbi:retinol dehydrogenase 7-like [Synchiropus picturatus]
MFRKALLLPPVVGLQPSVGVWFLKTSPFWSFINSTDKSSSASASCDTQQGLHSAAMFLYLLGLGAFYYVYRWVRELPRVSDKNSKYVYITGCDTGFGNLLARHLDKQGFRVIAACYTEAGEEELRKACSSSLITTHLDVRSNESVHKVAAMIKEKVGERGLWAVVNNAGVAVPSAPCDWLTIEDYTSMLDVNLNGVIAVTLSVLPLIKKARGRVVNMASVFGRISVVGGPYSVSKYGVEAFNDSLRLNMKAFGVKVLCIEPGFFKTNVTNADILGRNVKMLWGKLPQEVKDDYGPEYLQKSLDILTGKVSKISDGELMKVVRCMEHAVSAVRPRTRYSPGWDAKFFWLPLSYMPSCVTDYLMGLENIPIAKKL